MYVEKKNQQARETNVWIDVKHESLKAACLPSSNSWIIVGETLFLNIKENVCTDMCLATGLGHLRTPYHCCCIIMLQMTVAN